MLFLYLFIPLANPKSQIFRSQLVLTSKFLGFFIKNYFTNILNNIIISLLNLCE